MGHSEGGILAPNVAFGRTDVAAVIMLAPLFSPLEDQSIAQLRRAADLRKKQWDIIGSSKLEALAGAQEKCRAAVAAAPDAKKFCGGVSHRAWAAFRETALATPPKDPARVDPAMTIRIAKFLASVKPRNALAEQKPEPKPH